MVFWILLVLVSIDVVIKSIWLVVISNVLVLSME